MACPTFNNTSMKNDESQSPKETGTVRRIVPRVLVFLVIIAAWYGISFLLPLESWLLNMLARVGELGPWGPFVFILLYLPSCVLMFPDLLPNAAAGAVWGVGIGTVAVSLGRVLGSTATFLLTRGVAGGWAERKMASDPRFEAIAGAIGREGFRLVVLLRLCPMFPVIMLNYSLGLTPVTLRAYVLGTLIGMIPRTIFVAYLGSGTRSLFDPAGGGETISIHPVFYWGGLALSLLVVAILAWRARRLINEATQ